jgi:hypothetical protein
METLNIPTTHEPFVAPERAAAFLALSRKTVLKLARRGDLRWLDKAQDQSCTRSETAMESQKGQATNQTDLVRAHQTVNPNSAVALEKHYSVPAKIWFLSENTVRRIFLEEPGVLKLTHQGNPA